MIIWTRHGQNEKIPMWDGKSADLEGRPPKQHILGSGGSENESIQKIPTRGASTNLT